MAHKLRKFIFGLLVQFLFTVALIISALIFKYPKNKLDVYKFWTMTFIFSLTKEQIYVVNQKQNIDKFMDFIYSKPFDFKSSDCFLLENRKTFLRNYRDFKVIVVFDIPLFIFTKLLSSYQQKYVVKKIISQTKNKRSLVQFKEEIFDKFVYEQFFLSKSKIHLVTTQSQLNKLPLVFNHKKDFLSKSMIWYSANSIPIPLKSNIQYEYPVMWNQNLKHIDIHYIWTKPHKNDILKISRAKYKVVGSMLFYTGIDRYENTNNKFRILVLDVTPIANLSADNFYNYEYAIEFIKDIVMSVSEVKKTCPSIELILKPKRQYAKMHNQHYLTFINSLQKKNLLKCIPYWHNIYSEISKSRLIISPAYSSGVFIAKEMKIKSCYYVPSVSAQKFKLEKVMYGSPVLTGTDQLTKFLSQ